LIRVILVPLVAALALATSPAVAQPKGCPPGLAKKNPPGVPPGLSEKGWRAGDTLGRGDYRRLRDPSRYGLRLSGDYLIVDGFVMRVDPDTRAILTIIGAAAELLD
jgi:hypothetical protein